ncbi:MAG TPA: hypothetical protein VGQ52_10735 [Gemmatimonadaceae bacterium]|jgi:hypothetical protein|nr:hypothetical protein [Gemmatimonadaceae bacterium]
MSTVAESPPPRMLFYRDAVLPGQEATYEAIERDAARICAELHCPNVHLAIESLSGPKEVWWLTPFTSEEDKQRILTAYAHNAALTTALAGITKRKEGVVGPAVEVFTNYRADLSHAATWGIERARFFIVTVTDRESPAPGSVFEAPDGTRYIVRLTATREAADDLARTAGAGTTVFAIRPYWGMPAKEWIAADPEFWKASPMAQHQ